jgi:hypothetical protein
VHSPAGLADVYRTVFGHDRALAGVVGSGAGAGGVDATIFVVSQLSKGFIPDNPLSGLSGLSGILIGPDPDNSIE